MEYLEQGYDETDPISIEKFAQRLVGKTFRTICEEDDLDFNNVVREKSGYEVNHENRKRKGALGEIIEERFFHYKCNSDSRPDFDKAGVELKVSPYKIIKKGNIVAKERLSITMIDYFEVVNESFEKSHLWSKARLILLIYYLYKKEIKERLDYEIGYAKLFSPPERDLKIIHHDYDIIIEKIRSGKAHELSESDTLYLGAASKATTSNDRRKQPFNDIMAKPRAFAYKNSYMTYILNSYVVPGKLTYEPIMKENVNEFFEDYVIRKVSTYHDYSISALCNIFNIDMTKKPKNLEAMLIYKILGIKGNHAEEFLKANVVVKTIRIENNNKIKESMSFPTFKFKELIEESWENSIFGTYLRETRFLFVVYKADSEHEYHLKGCQFWNMPVDDIELQVYSVWERTRNIIKQGLIIEAKNGTNGNNLPKASENPVCHVRPHARNAQDTYVLPDGRQYPKQSFWLNNKYILSQLDRRLYENI